MGGSDVLQLRILHEELPQRLLFDLPDALTGDLQLLSDLLQRVGLPVNSTFRFR